MEESFLYGGMLSFSHDKKFMRQEIGSEEGLTISFRSDIVALMIKSIKA
ncbi:hypothetical protein [Paenibacillus apiarius]|nr:hypothetical protein [Paenibacillus apiarius]MBN3523034.1 hypothetical protein [Paenibacillus apiarius]